VKGVDAIVDVVNSGVALAVSQITKERNKVLLATGPATSELTGVSCSPNTIQWTYDTYALSRGTGGALTRTGGDTWFFITADYAFGHALERDTSNVVETSGGKVLGRVRVPVNTADFASYLMQAQSSGAKVVGLANAGADTINAIKQASEFGLTHSKIRLAGMLIALSDVHSLGTNLAQGLVITQAFYWDLNDSTRAWSRRFGERRNGQMPGQVHAGAYSATLHYLKAVSALKSKADGASVVAKMKALATNDPLFGKGRVRVDGRKMHDMYLFEVKRPSESKAEWDLLKLLSTIPADDAFRPLDNNGCHLVKN
jgi:branched-chain amino acid transport system substrate-binding protein